MTMVEHRSNGKVSRKKHVPQDKLAAREAAESVFKTKAAKPETGEETKPTFVLPEETSRLVNPDKFCVSLSVSDGVALQANFRISRHLWESIGKPKRVDIVGTPDSGYNIMSGVLYKVQIPEAKQASRMAVLIQVSARKVSCPPQKRAAFKIEAQLRNGLIFVPPFPEYWISGTPEGEVKAAPEPEGQTLPDTTVEETPAEQSDIGSIAINKNGASVGTFLCIPVLLLSKIGDPTRLKVRGRCSEGFTLEPTMDGDGIKVQYSGGSNAYFSFSALHIGLHDKQLRKPYSVRMRVKDGKIKVAGPSYEWIRGANMWLRNPPAPIPLAQSPSITVAPTPVSHAEGVSPLPKASASYEIPATNAGVPELQAHISSLLSQFIVAKRQLEERTGMKFLLTKQMSLVVDLGTPNGFVPPNQQKDIPKVNGH